MSDDIADMMDLSSVAEFLKSLETKGIFERVFSWKNVITGAEQARFALAMITEEYREKVAAYRRTVKRFADDRTRAYADCAALREENQVLKNRLWTCEQRERRLETRKPADDGTEDGQRKAYQEEIDRELEYAWYLDSLAKEPDAEEETIRAAYRPRTISEELKTMLAAPFITLRSSSLSEPQLIDFLEAWMEVEEALKMIGFAVSEGYYGCSDGGFRILDTVLDIERVPPDFRPSRSVIAEAQQEPV